MVKTTLNLWEVVENQFDIKNNFCNETIFAQGNGYLGMRGTFEEGYAGPDWPGVEGTYINGFYETETIKYPEIAYGYPEKSQTMLNVTDCKVVKVFIDDEEFNMLTGEITDYRRILSFKEGILSRSLVWSSPQGKKIKVDIERIISLVHQHWVAIRYEVTSLNFSGKIKIVTALNGDVTNLSSEKDPRVGSGLRGRVLEVKQIIGEDDFGVIVQQTQKSGLSLAAAMMNRIETGSPYTTQNKTGESTVEVEYQMDASPKTSIVLTKYLAVVTSLEMTDVKNLAVLAKKEVLKAAETGFDLIKQSQSDFLNDFWYRSDVTIEGDPAIQQGIRFNIFHLLQSVGRNGRTNIAAKGLTGEGYEGHYFWDTETYILPFFSYTYPEISRKLLEFRYNTLDKARERARQMAHSKGALFPWRTINGDECSTYFPGGTAQYHINADIAFAIKRYVEATGDYDFLIRYGAEILFETARLYADLGDFIPAKGNRFCINGVTGPDEYTALVNNNCYTNLMAKENLQYACQIAEWLKQNAISEYQRVVHNTGLEESELEAWKRAADEMYIPYDSKLKIHLQDDDFLNRAPWDFENTPSDKYPLLMHYHPLVIYRHQVCKQADLVLALFLLGNRFNLEDKRRNFDYYEKITTHDSSLSKCIFSIMASEIGDLDKAYRYFLETVRTDLDDIQKNTKDGIHAANMAGAWMCMVYGFAGMRVYDGVLSFNPVLPREWQKYQFRINIRESIIEITIDQKGAFFNLIQGNPLTLICNGERINLDGNCPNKFKEKVG
jgi:alpha,alpha-trehalose phosphorylase